VATEIGELQREALLAASSEGMIVLAADGVVTSPTRKPNRCSAWPMGTSGNRCAIFWRASRSSEATVCHCGGMLAGLRALRGETVRNLDVGFHWEAARTGCPPVRRPSCSTGCLQRSGGDLVGCHHVAHLELHHEQLIRLVSHDIRNPLTSVHLNAQLLQKNLAERAWKRRNAWSRPYSRRRGVWMR